MNELAKDVAIQVAALIDRYGFDLGGYPIGQLIDYWLQLYPAPWLRLATIEALYQGRYKVVSIDQILSLWGRRNRPVYHFNREFEQIIFQRHTSGSAKQTRSSSATSETGQSIASASPALKPRNGVPVTVMNSSVAADPEDTSPAQPTFSDIPSLTFRSMSEMGNPTIETFQPPKASESLEEAQQWKQGTGRVPIHQFIPDPKPSEFYLKLKAVAHNTAESATTVS